MKVNVKTLSKYIIALVLSLLIGFLRLRQEKYTFDAKYMLPAEGHYVQEKLESRTTGILKRAYFRAGERFNKGDLMFEIENPDLPNQLAEEQAKEPGPNTQQNLQRIQDDIFNLKIYAPFDGYVVKESVALDEEIGHGEELAKVTTLENFRTAVVLKETEYNNLPVELKSLIKIGRRVEIKRYDTEISSTGVIDGIEEKVKDKKTGRKEITILVKPTDLYTYDYKLTDGVQIYLPKQTLIKRVMASADMAKEIIK